MSSDDPHGIETTDESLEFDVDSDSSLKSIPSHIDRYKIEGRLGQGGFGTVYLALDAQLDRHVAIKCSKVIHRDFR